MLWNKMNRIAWRDKAGRIYCPGDACNAKCDDKCPIWLNTCGLGMIRDGRPDKAIGLFEKAISIAPDFADAHNNLGSAYGMSNLHSKALKEFQTALQLRTPYPSAQRGIIVAEKNLGKYAEALRHCDEYDTLPGCDAGELRREIYKKQGITPTNARPAVRCEPVSSLAEEKKKEIAAAPVEKKRPGEETKPAARAYSAEAANPERKQGVSSDKYDTLEQWLNQMLQNNTLSQKNAETNEEAYGAAWLKIASDNPLERALGIAKMRRLDQAEYIEGTLALAMYVRDDDEREQLLKKAADAGNAEGMWQYAGYLPHSDVPDPNNKQDALWETYCLGAAERGCVDAMNEMGNIFHRRKNYAESMYWYAMANYFGREDGRKSMRFIAGKWVKAGGPSSFKKGSSKFDEARFKCALALLEMYGGKQISTGTDELIRLSLSGVPIAAYLAGDIFEANEDYTIAYKLYNAIAIDNDPHGLKCCADMLMTGRGVKQNEEKAKQLYQEAANGGDSEAMYIMGELARGRDHKNAARWYGQAVARGLDYAAERLVDLNDDTNDDIEDKDENCERRFSVSSQNEQETLKKQEKYRYAVETEDGNLAWVNEEDLAAFEEGQERLKRGELPPNHEERVARLAATMNEMAERARARRKNRQ